MRRSILLALLAVAISAVPALASVKDVQVSGRLNNQFIARDHFALGTANQTGNTQNIFIRQATLRVDAKMTENVDVAIQLINEGPWTQEDSSQNDIDINLAYIALREMLDPHFTAIVGRQDFRFGNSFVFDTAGTNNSTTTGTGLDNVAEDLTWRTAQDGVRLEFDYAPLKVTAFATKVNANTVAATGAMDDDIDMYGIVANYAAGDFSLDSVAEPYFMYRNDQSMKVGGIPGSGLHADTLYMPGIRVSTNPIAGLHLEAEAAFQSGRKVITTATAGLRPQQKATMDRAAHGEQFIANYVLPFDALKQWEPVTTLVYTHVSGDSNPGNVSSGTNHDRWTAWDPLFENQGGGTIYNSLFNLTNVNIVSSSAKVKAMEDVTAKLTGTWMWLDQSPDAASVANAATCSGTSCFPLIQPGQSGTVSPTVFTGAKKLGWELDADVVWAYTEDVSIGFSAGWLFLGDVFHNNSFADPNKENPKQFLANVDVAF